MSRLNLTLHFSTIDFKNVVFIFPWEIRYIKVFLISSLKSFHPFFSRSHPRCYPFNKYIVSLTTERKTSSFDLSFDIFQHFLFRRNFSKFSIIYLYGYYTCIDNRNQISEEVRLLNVINSLHFN